MYEYTKAPAQNGMGGVLQVATGLAIPAVAAVAYAARVRSRRMTQAEAQQYAGQQADVCANMPPTELMRQVQSNPALGVCLSQHSPFTLCQVLTGRACSAMEVMDAICSNESLPPHPSCNAVGAQALEEQQQQEYMTVTAPSSQNFPPPPLKGLGWSDVEGTPSCPNLPSGEQRCFLTSENEFASRQGCVPVGGNCQTHSGSDGHAWCCPPGWPRPPGSPPLQEGEGPPEPPGGWYEPQSVFRQPWFIAGAAGMAVSALFLALVVKKSLEKSNEEG